MQNVSKEQTKAQPGTVTDVTKDSFSVQTGDGTLIVQELQISGKEENEDRCIFKRISSRKKDVVIILIKGLEEEHVFLL